MVKLFGLGLVLVFMVSLKVSVMVRIRTPLFAIAPPPLELRVSQELANLSEFCGCILVVSNL